MANVLLVNPRITPAHKARFPLSLLALAAALAGRHTVRIVDGNKAADDGTAATVQALVQERFDVVGLTVMGGPQVRTAIDVSRAVRDVAPGTPVAWGGYFPTLYPDAALNAPYVDHLVRGQGEAPLAALLDGLDAGATAFDGIAGLSWKRGDERVHNADAAFAPTFPGPLPYDLLGDPRRYLIPTYIGARTVMHQAALGCRFRCTFCGVAAMFRGATALPPAARLEQDLAYLRDTVGADSVQFCDHNFFDREEDTAPLLEVLARAGMDWWCYARSDALLGLSPESWALVRRSRLRMAYIGAESPNDALLRDIRKGTRSDQTLEVAELCRRHRVVPELSFMVAPPHDPDGETERTFEFIREVKRVNPAAEIVIYVYTPLPAGSLPGNARARASTLPLVDADGRPIVFPASPEEWTERRWVDYACHADAP